MNIKLLVFKDGSVYNLSQLVSIRRYTQEVWLHFSNGQKVITVTHDEKVYFNIREDKLFKIASIDKYYDSIIFALKMEHISHIQAIVD